MDVIDRLQPAQLLPTVGVVASQAGWNARLVRGDRRGLGFLQAGLSADIAQCLQRFLGRSEALANGQALQAGRMHSAMPRLVSDLPLLKVGRKL